MAPVTTRETLVQRLLALPGGRHLVGLAGPPASGKSTLAAQLVAQINARSAGRAALLAMDGYHLDDSVLKARGHLLRKGAPHTFDVAGLRHMLDRLRRNDDPEVAAPVFDRDIEIARAGASIIPQSADIILVEGNYLLLRQEPWSDLAARFDLTIALDVSEAELRRRLTRRWEGYQMSPAQIASKLEDTDLPNARLVLRAGLDADIVLTEA